MAKAATTLSRIPNFNVLGFVDSVKLEIGKAQGIIDCAGDAGRTAGEEGITAALSAAEDILVGVESQIDALWEAEQARSRLEQEKCDAAKTALGVGHPPPMLTLKTRKHLLKMLADDLQTRKAVARGRRRRKAGKGRAGGAT